ncbi:Threonyl/alanyl tRNA synthetase [Aspergillus egyptiacus]|nr:Threonyl/alanyl tRNA synthetase [Aspergillus egyptiacus]
MPDPLATCRCTPLYLTDASLHTSTTTLTSIQQVATLDEEVKRLAKNIQPEDFALTTRTTIFYPQGGGQPSDTGVIVSSESRIQSNNLNNEGEKEEEDASKGAFEFEVLLVRKTSDGSILHFGRFATSPSSEILLGAQLCFNGNQMSKEVSLRIDSQKRNYHSRLHTAGHILGLAMRLLAPVLGERKKVKANHFPGEASMEFEGMLYNEHKGAIQDKVDEIVAQQLSVRISWWDEEEVERRKEELDMVEGREVGGMGRVRIAEIGEVDANPCGGTHVEHTGATGRILIRKIGRQKGVTRVSYEVPVIFE